MFYLADTYSMEIDISSLNFNALKAVSFASGRLPIPNLILPHLRVKKKINKKRRAPSVVEKQFCPVSF